MLEVISIPCLVEGDGSVKIILESLDVPKDRLRRAGDVEILVKIRFPHLFRKPRAVRITVFLQLCHQPNQPYQLFLAHRHFRVRPSRFRFPVVYNQRLDILCQSCFRQDLFLTYSQSECCSYSSGPEKKPDFFDPCRLFVCYIVNLHPLSGYCKKKIMESTKIPAKYSTCVK